MKKLNLDKKTRSYKIKEYKHLKIDKSKRLSKIIKIKFKI